MSHVMRSYFVGVLLVAVALAVVAVEFALPVGRAPYSMPPMFWTPCDLISSRTVPITEDSPLVWFYDEALIPSELLQETSGIGRLCSAGVGTVAGGREYQFSVTFTFLQGEGNDRETVVWWRFFQEWEDRDLIRAELYRRSEWGTVTFHDGYAVAVNSRASDEIKQAAEATPDTDVWEVAYEQSLAE